MAIVVTITESDYLEIVRWGGDGGPDFNISYRIVPDGPPPRVSSPSSPPGNPGPSKSGLALPLNALLSKDGGTDRSKSPS
jgi:hypothetical protein